jgi:hypothetical protein
MNPTVPLNQAFSWTCQSCKRTNYEPAIPLEPEQVDHMVSGESREMAEGLPGVWIMAPTSVTCRGCGARLDVEEG